VRQVGYYQEFVTRCTVKKIFKKTRNITFEVIEWGAREMIFGN